MDITQYDNIFIGTPIWAGTYAPPIKTFFEDPALTNKNIYFFYTHDGGPGRVEKHAKIAIEAHSTYGGSQGFLNVKKNFDANIEVAKLWISSLNLNFIHFKNKETIHRTVSFLILCHRVQFFT